MFPSVTTAELENTQAGPFFDSTNSYGGSSELASRCVPQLMLGDSQPNRRVAEAIWEGYQILSAPLKMHQLARSLPNLEYPCLTICRRERETKSTHQRRTRASMMPRGTSFLARKF